MARWILLLLYALQAVRPDQAADDHIVFMEQGGEDAATNRLVSEYFSMQEQECFKEEKFLYEPDKKCYTLLTEGPCDCRNSGRGSSKQCEEKRERWLVLERLEGGRLRAVCRPCPCCARPLHVFLAADGKCHHRTKELRRFCPHNGTELRDNLFGEGECGCTRSPPHARVLGAPGGVCHPLYRRGPCRPGQVLLPERDRRTLEPAARCAPDPCADKGEGYAQWQVGDGECYQLGSQGPCDSQSKFSVQRITRVPDCSQPTNTIVDPKEFTHAQPPPTSLPRVDKDFALDLLSSARGKRRAGRP